MTITLELTAAQEARLRARATSAGQEPAAYLLTLADRDDTVPNKQQDTEFTEDAENGSAYDLFNGLLGGWGSGGADLSENCGEKFAEGMTEKREQGHL